jgi:hypothetical protein
MTVLPPSLNDKLRLLTARVMLGQARPNELVEFACDLLVAGLDVPSAVELAGRPYDMEMRDAEPLFRQLVEDLGRPPMPKVEAAWVVARTIAQQLLADSIPAPVGARILSGLCRDAGNPEEIGAFVELFDAWGERLPDERADLESEMRQLAPAVILAADRTVGSSD